MSKYKRDELVEVPYDHSCMFRESEKSWFICWGETTSERDESGKFFPKSQCKIDEDEKIIYVPEWLAKMKGVI